VGKPKRRSSEKKKEGERNPGTGAFRKKQPGRRENMGSSDVKGVLGSKLKKGLIEKRVQGQSP